MRTTPVWLVLVVLLIAGCGGGSDDSSSGDGSGSASSTGPSAGDKQYIDPFQDCLTKRQAQEKIFTIASEIKNAKRRERAIQNVRERVC